MEAEIPKSLRGRKPKLIDPKICPECSHIFKGNGWDGIDAHWKAKHEDVMPYERAWPLRKGGIYPGQI